MATSPDTLEFRAEFAAETDVLLRRRLRKFILIWGGLGLFWSAWLWVLRLHPAFEGGAAPVESASLPEGLRFGLIGFIEAAWLAAYVVGFVMVRRKAASKRVIRLSLLLVLADGLLALLTSGLSDDASGFAIARLMLVHLIASAVFPWTPLQALLPMLGVLATLGVLAAVTSGLSLVDFLLVTVAVGFMAAPGTVLAWLRHSLRLQRFSQRFLQTRYGALRQELASARRIHEALFPRPVTEGPVGITYAYEPMRQIGGDFLFSTVARPAAAGLHAARRAGRHSEADRAGAGYSVVLLDVTGHGIPAALTVNRLHGELELLFADRPDASPAEVMAALNRYVYLTLARHSIYVTGICLRVRPEEDALEYVNAGHPPAFLRASDGTVHELNSTTFLLGACDADLFDPTPSRLVFGAGDSLIAYTDGATEARTEEGQMLRIEGMRSLVASRSGPRQGDWPDAILRQVGAHRAHRAPEDDTLVVEVFRPVLAPRTPGPVLRDPSRSGASGHADAVAIA